MHIEPFEQTSGTVPRHVLHDFMAALDADLDPGNVRGVTFDGDGVVVEMYSLPQRLEGDSCVTYKRLYRVADVPREESNVQVHLDAATVWNALLRLKRERGGGQLGLA